ncbi:uncharacterized protein LOC127422508 [Myxocyprinus asiaticus]|uniref:uncharacterized protein LOC127422508 n=1 Tax=Myxocyprinus asiaticus TaxID=70543 RepID=UPI002221333E|nr:uncharacterized protein LOC127422508 [Myxocyprinus asiaticus]
MGGGGDASLRERETHEALVPASSLPILRTMLHWCRSPGGRRDALSESSRHCWTSRRRGDMVRWNWSGSPGDRGAVDGHQEAEDLLMSAGSQRSLLPSARRQSSVSLPGVAEDRYPAGRGPGDSVSGDRRATFSLSLSCSVSPTHFFSLPSPSPRLSQFPKRRGRTAERAAPPLQERRWGVSQAGGLPGLNLVVEECDEEWGVAGP